MCSGTCPQSSFFLWHPLHWVPTWCGWQKLSLRCLRKITQTQFPYLSLSISFQSNSLHNQSQCCNSKSQCRSCSDISPMEFTQENAVDSVLSSATTKSEMNHPSFHQPTKSPLTNLILVTSWYLSPSFEFIYLDTHILSPLSSSF